MNAESLLLDALERVRSGEMEFFVLVGTYQGCPGTGSMMWMPTSLDHERRADIIQGLYRTADQLESPAICSSCRQLMSHPFCVHCSERLEPASESLQEDSLVSPLK